MAASTVEAVSLPFEEAIAYFRQKVPAAAEDWTSVWREAHTRSFAVAGATTEALATDFQKAVGKALADGTTLAEFRKEFDAIVERHGWAHTGSPGWRASIIYETNVAGAYSAGRYAQQTDPAVLAAFPYWTYRHSGAQHPRLMHLAWDGLTLKADDPFWSAHYPPNGWRCGCRVSLTSEGSLGRMGKKGPDAAPPTVTEPWVNPRTGETHQVPVGVDAGFDFNPGAAWQKHGRGWPLRAERSRPLARLPQPSDKQLDAIRDFVRAPHGTVPVGDLTAPVRAVLGAQTDQVLLSAETMDKQLARHPEITEDDYLLLPLVLGAPDLVAVQAASRVVLLRAGAKVLRAAVKTTEDGSEIYLASLHYMDAGATRRFLRHARVVFGTIAQVVK